MESDEENIDIQQERNMHDLKKLYYDAYYWHLVHEGYAPKRAKLVVMIRKMKSMSRF